MLRFLASRCISSAILIFGLVAVTAHAQATPASIDTFTVTRNGSILFEDTFDNGDPNDTGWVYGNGNQAVYSGTPGVLPGPETNGKLLLDPYSGAIINSGLTGNPIYMNRARLVTNTSNSASNLHRGLKDDDTFSVRGVFDLTTPTNVGERYGIRLTDRGSSNGNGNDTVEVDVKLRSSGLIVEFREQDVLNSTNIVMDMMDLSAASLGLTDTEFAMYDQIALVLDRATTTSAITGSFSLIDNQGLIADYNYNFNGSSTIFEGERFTRAEFLSVAPVPASEPASLLIFGLGLLGLFAARRRRTL